MFALAALPVAAEATVENTEVSAWSSLPRMLPEVHQVKPVSLSGSRLHAQQAGRAKKEQLDERRFHPGKAAYLSAGLALSGGVLAWLSKREADNAYDHYLRAAGSERQKTQFDRAERFDRLSGAAFAAMEAGVLMTAYFTFF
jgi:hypothetical protein